MSVTCIIIFVKARVRIRYTLDRRRAAAVTSRSRYTVCLDNYSQDTYIRGRTENDKLTDLE
jgi:hypothetical protein